jgi:GntR family transcriptional regulator
VENIDALIRVGCVTRVQFCGLKEIAASEALAKTFGIPPGAKLAQIQKLAFLDDEPFIHTTIHVPSELAAKIPLDRIGEKQVFALIEENCSVRIQEAHQWVSASLAGGTIARDLKLKPGDPILLLERHFEATDGRMIEESIDRYRTDRMRHYLRLTRTDSLGVVPIDRTLGNPRHPSRSPSEGDRRSEDE